MKLRRILLLLLISVFCSCSFASIFEDLCAKSADPAFRLTGFFIELVQQGLIGTKGIKSFVQDDQLSGQGQAALEADLAVEPFSLEHFRREYSNFSESERESFRAYIERYLLKIEGEAIEKSQVQIDTVSTIEFVHISKGSVVIPDLDINKEQYSREVSIPSDLKVMSTHVTFEMFEETVGKHLRAREDDPEFPIYRSTIWMAMFFANKLSELHGFEPFYSLPELVWNDVGQMRPHEIIPSLNDVVAEKTGQSRKALGYRLPTLNEMEYILGSVEQKLEWEAEDYSLRLLKTPENEKFYWTWKNSNGELQIVGTRDPLTVQGHKIYDLYGLVKHWLHPTDPQVDFKLPPIFNVGDIFMDFTNFVSSGSDRAHSTNVAGDRVGFRLVREVSP